jgi:hypothetical protein
LFGSLVVETPAVSRGNQGRFTIDQSLWLDNVTLDFIDSGTLKRYGVSITPSRAVPASTLKFAGSWIVAAQQRNFSATSP